jgi:hypothetical protein
MIEYSLPVALVCVDKHEIMNSIYKLYMEWYKSLDFLNMQLCEW